MLKHADIWRAIDRLAEINGLTPSGLARKSGLCPTSFNPSKRVHAGRNRWPSTESIAAILMATSTDLDSFVALASHDAPPQVSLPMLTLEEASKKEAFDEKGYPAIASWDRLPFPGSDDPHAFAIEVSGSGLEPMYREGSRLIVAPAEQPRRGDRVLLRTARGEMMARALARDGAQKIELAAFNPIDPPLTLARADIEWMYRIVWASQ